MLNKWEQSIVDRLRHGLQNRHAVMLGADEVHIPMNAILDRDTYRELGSPDEVASLIQSAARLDADNLALIRERDELRAKAEEAMDVAREIIRLVFAEGCEGEPEFEALHDRLCRIAGDK